MKRVICFAMCLLLIVGCVTPAAYAADIEPDTQVLAQPGDVQIEATNRIGSLLSAEITEVEQDSESSGQTAHVITDLTVDGNTAVVSYSAEDYATVVVALYSEDGLRMLTSASGEASPDASEITVTFSGEMPEYFLARAYMLGLDDCTPLSDVYETLIYTQSMQELLDSTIDDYDPELVVNFDDDPNTNFAVYNEGVVIVDEVAGVNIVTTNDDENLLYVIENADDTFTTLQEGDIVSYFYGEDQLLLCMVATIEIEGSTVIIHGSGDFEIEEVFSDIKIENDANTNDFTATDLSPDDNVTVVESNTRSAVVQDVGAEGEIEKSIRYDIIGDEWKSKNGEKVKVSGGLGLEIKIGMEFAFYYTDRLKQVRFKVDYNIQAIASFEGSAEIYLADFSNINSDGISAFKIRFSPKLILRFSGEVEATAGLSGTIGFDYTDKYGIQNLCTKPVLKSEVEIEGSVFLGWDFHPEAFSIHEKLAKVELSVPFGYTIKGKLTGTKFEVSNSGIAPSIHECEKCWDGNRFFGIELEPSITLFDKLSLSKKFVFEWKPVHFYISKTFDEKGDGECPHKQYLLTIEVRDNAKNPVESVEIHAADVSAITNKDGVAYLYLPSGRHNVTAYFNDYVESWMIQVNEGRAKLKLIFGDEMFYFSEFIDESLLDHIADESLLADSGSCGDHVTWSYYENGTLIIEGTGPMYDIKSIYSRPWPYTLGQIFIRDGVTHIGANAFNQIRFSSLFIPSSLTSIGAGAFLSSNITRITVPDGVTTIGDSAFAYCDYLRQVVIPESVTSFGESMFKSSTKLKDITLSGNIGILPGNTFYECSSLESVFLPEGIHTIGVYAFYNCKNLSEVVLPSTLTHIQSRAFQHAQNLKSIDLPDGLEYIGERTFCQSGLESIYIPDTVTEIREGAFNTCEHLMSVHLPSGLSVIEDSMFFGNSCMQEITIPDSVTSIEYWAFNQCESLTNIVIPENVTTLGWGAFSGCKNLCDIQLPDNLTILEEDVFYGCGFTEFIIPDSIITIGPDAFCDCNKLRTIVIPDSVISIGSGAFYGCTALESVVIPDSVVSMGSYLFTGCSGLKSAELSNSLHTIKSSTFLNCTSLESIEIPSGITTLEDCVFEGCSNLEYVSIPDTVLYLGDSIFESCYSLQDVTIPGTWREIPNYTFQNCDSLTRIDIPATVNSLGLNAFAYCDTLSEIWFQDGPPNSIAYYAFSKVTANAYYPGDNDYWLTGNMQDYGGSLTWYPYYYDDNGDIIIGEATVFPTAYVVENELPAVNQEIPAEEMQPTSIETLTTEGQGTTPPTLDAIFGGEYGAEDMGDYFRRTASFSGLIPGAQYVMLSMVNIDTAEPVAPENLLYIDQAEAGEDGTIQFIYVQRVTTDPSYVVLCGPATKNLADADITLPEYYSDGELHVVNPVVIYDGETLIEGRDYEISGQVCFDECGTYTCFIRGIHNYTGTMQCVYTVGEWNCDEMGHDYDDGCCRYCGEEDPNYEPTEPTEPDEPTDPDDPTDPIDPTEPEDPTDPTEPSDGAVIRLSGSNRYQTGFAVADQLKRNMGVERFEAVVVAYGQNFPDALTGSYLAAVKGAPILLTEPGADAGLLDYLKDNLTSGGTVYILGGTAAVSQSFEDDAESLGFNVKRLKGAGRYETNLAILAEAGVSREDEVLIATGKNYADSLSASATGLPMLLVDTKLTDSQREFLETTSRKFVIIGGTGAVSAQVEAELETIGDVVRVKGANRYGTSVEIAKRYFTNPQYAVLAYAQGFPDGLCGGPLALSMGAPLILTSNDSYAIADEYVTGIEVGAVTGGTGRISDDTVRKIFDLSSDTPIIKP